MNDSREGLREECLGMMVERKTGTSGRPTGAGRWLGWPARPPPLCSTPAPKRLHSLLLSSAPCLLLSFSSLPPIPSIVCESLLSNFRRTSGRHPVIRSDLPISASHTRFLAYPRLTSAFHHQIALIYRLTT